VPLGACTQFPRDDPAVVAGDLIGTGDLIALPGFDGLDEVGGVKQAVVSTGVETGEAASEQ